MTIAEWISRAAQQVGGLALPRFGSSRGLDLVTAASRPVVERAGEPASTLVARNLFAGANTYAGKTVTVERSLSLDAVYACVRLISEVGGAMPLKVYQRTRGGDGRFEVWSDPIYRLLHNEPNRESTAIDVWALVLTHLATWGNAFIGKQVRGGRVVGLWPIQPSRVRVERVGGAKTFWELREDGTERRMSADQVIHIHLMSLDGLIGLSPISQAREAVGMGLSLDETGNRVFSNGAILRGLIQLPEGKELTQGAADRLRTDFERLHQSQANAYRTAVLEDGAQFNTISMPLHDAEWVEAQKLTVQKIARIHGVPPEMIGADSGSTLTYSTVEGQGRWFLTYGLNPLLTRIEQAVNSDRDLFPGDDRSTFCEFERRQVLQADVKTRYEAYKLAVEAGWLDVSEIRRWENLPPRQEQQMPPPEAEARVAVERLLADIQTNGAQ